MTYDQALSYIHSLEKFGINPGLERIAALCNALGNPQDKLKYIHVAGTNGKGSTSTMLSEIMQTAGYKTGLFTSPYVVDFRERIQINGKMISQKDLAVFVSEIEPVVSELAVNGVQITEFEFITATAFLYFARNECDVVMLEAGLGGRFDSTNIINNPLVSAITSISMDHTAVLGDTIEKIAAEKCGIIKQNGLTVSYPKQPAQALKMIKKTVAAKGNMLYIPDLNAIQIIDDSILGTQAVIAGLPLQVPLMGEHMVYNASVAITAARVVRQKGIMISDEDIAQGIEAARIPARMEILGEEPLIIVDGGHNAGCAQALEAVIKKHLSGRKIIAVCGMMADKDYNAYLKIVAPFFETLIATKPDNSRALDAQILADTTKKHCKNIITIEDPWDAYSQAKNLANKDDVIIVCGSFYLAAEVREKIIILKHKI